MKKPQWLTLLILFSILLILGGCSENNSVTIPTQTDQQALKAAVTEIDSVADFSASDEISIDDDGMKNPEFDGMATPGMETISLGNTSADSIYPVRWGRHIFRNNIVRNYSVLIQGDTLAFVLITKTIPGEFIVGWGTRTIDTVIVQDTIKKSFTETVQRKVTFKRVARTDNPRKNWRPIAITIVDGKTNDVNIFSIVSLQINVPERSYDTTFVDPLNHWFRLGLFRGSIPKFFPGDSIVVKLTVTSADSSPEIVHIRHGIANRRPERGRMKMNLESTTGTPGNYVRVYTRSFRARLPMGIIAARCNIITDVLSNGTIYSTTLPFSNEFWGVPYIVRR